MASGSRPAFAVFALAAIAALGYANWYATATEIELSPILPGTTGAALAPSPQAVPEDKIAALGEFQETLARPLFNSTRRPDPEVTIAPPPPPPQQPPQKEPEPPPAPTAAAPAILPPPEHLQLIGMMHQGGERHRALIRIDSAGTTKWYETGADIAGWRLSEIAADHVVIEGGGQRSELTLHAQKPPSAGAP